MISKLKVGQTLITARNIVNQDDINNSIQELMEHADNVAIAKWLKSVFRSYLLNKHKASKVKLKVSKKNPDWLNDAIERGDILYKVAIAKPFLGKIKHVIDYFRSEKKPKFTKMSVTDAIKQSEAWLKESTDSAKEKMSKKDEEVLIKLSNGYYIVNLKTPKAQRREGERMQHCLKDECNRQNYTSSGQWILSLRDSSDKPHATFEVTKDGGVDQMKGKQNKAVIKKYQEYIHEFLEKYGAL